MAVLCAFERRGAFAYERPGNDASDLVLAVEHLSGDLADLILSIYRYYAFVSGDLKDRIGRCVNYRLACANVFLTKFLDDLGPAGRDVAKNAGNIRFADKTADDLVRKAVGKRRKSLFQDNSRDLPMSGRGILSISKKRTAAKRAVRACERRNAGQRLDIAQTEPVHIGQSDTFCLERIADGVRAFVAPRGGVRHLAYADGIQNDQAYSVESVFHK